MATNATEVVDGYARGLLTVVEAEGATERVVDELQRFGRALGANPALRDALADPSLPTERRIGVVEQLLDGPADRRTVATVALVIQSGRGRLLGDIITAIARAAAERRGRTLAEVRTAIELDEGQRTRLREALGRVVGHDVELDVVVDESVVGGVVATVGDTVIDGTVARQLARMRSQLVGA